LLLSKSQKKENVVSSLLNVLDALSGGGIIKKENDLRFFDAFPKDKYPGFSVYSIRISYFGEEKHQRG